MKQQRLSHTAEQSNFGRAVGKVVGVLVTLAVLAVAFMFSIVFFAIALTVGLLLGARIWWKTRALRQAMREQASGAMPPSDEGEGRVIEGEVIRSREGP